MTLLLMSCVLGARAVFRCLAPFPSHDFLAAAVLFRRFSAFTVCFLFNVQSYKRTSSNFPLVCVLLTCSTELQQTELSCRV